MKFSLSHSRATVGHDIGVSVDGEGKEISTVKTVLDSIPLANDTVNADTYQRSFHQVGVGGPFEDHTLVVTASGSDGSIHSSQARWTDPA